MGIPSTPWEEEDRGPAWRPLSYPISPEERDRPEVRFRLEERPLEWLNFPLRLLLAARTMEAGRG